MKTHNLQYSFTLKIPWYYKQDDGTFGRIKFLTNDIIPEYTVIDGIVYIGILDGELKRLFIPIRETEEEFKKIIGQ